MQLLLSQYILRGRKGGSFVAAVTSTFRLDGPERRAQRAKLFRPIFGALMLALLSFFAPIGGVAVTRSPAALAAGAAGRLLLPRNSGLTVLDLASGNEQPLYTTQQPVLGAVWSPDGGRVAFSQFGRAPGDRFGSANIYLLDGGQSTPAITRSGPDDFLSNPVWTSDGQALLYEAQGALSGAFSVEQAALDGSDRRTIERNGRMPALSPDGSLLAFVRMTNDTVLVVRPLAGGAPRELMAPDKFIGISYPRFSPDGQRLAFLGIGGTPDPPPVPLNPLSWFRLGPSNAQAHGIPWDPWVVNLDGSGLRRVADLAADDPAVAWAPDGSALAILGGDGLWLLPLNGSGSPNLISNGSYGVLDWRP
jgi:Tol biopolymer transport system component